MPIRVSYRFSKDSNTEENLMKLGLSERQIKAVLYTKMNLKITNREYRALFNLTDRMALYDLKILCELGILEKIGTTGRKH